MTLKLPVFFSLSQKSLSFVDSFIRLRETMFLINSNLVTNEITAMKQNYFKLIIFLYPGQRWTQSYETYLQPLIALIMPFLLTDDKAGLPSHSHYSSNFSDRYFRVHKNDMSSSAPLIYGVQFSDQLCFLYINILHHHHLLNSFKRIFNHFYADDALM